jgi:large subunit ribosomal protein L29
MMKANDLRNKTTAELEAQLTSLKKDLFFLRMQHATNQLENPLKIQTVKKDIARVKTILRERELRTEA